MTSLDTIVIGGGHNGLVCAAFLAKSGRKVLVLEAAPTIGGAAGTHEFAPGFRVSSLAHIVNRLHPEVVKALDLQSHGLDFKAARQIASVSLSATGAPLILHGAYGETLEGASTPEQSAWREVRAQLFRYAGILKPMLARRPPALGGGMSFAERSGLAMTGLALKKLGREDMRDFLRVMLMNVADFCDEQLSDDRLKGLLAFDAVLGSHLGPRSPTSLLGLYYRLTGETGVPGGQVVPIGGMGAVIAAIALATQKAGVEIRRDAPVGRILVENGKAVGVTLDSGEDIRATTIVSAINPRTTFIDLVGPRHLDTGFVRRVGNIRMKGDAAKLHLALDRAPEFAGLPLQHRNARLVIAPSTNHVERAFNPSKYGEFSPAPVMEITLPSIDEPDLAPRGACVISAVVQYAPYALKEGWETGKPKFLEAILSTLETYAPGIRKSVVHAELMTPLDIEQRFRMPGGHWHHGELQADQMLMSRPVFGAEGYDTPIGGLFLAGAGSHPGGGISGAPGMNAARRVMGMKG